MTRIRVGAASLNQTPLDWAHNTNNILRAIDAARQAEVSLLCLPELCVTGYGCEDVFPSTGLQQKALAALEEIVGQTSGMIVSVGVPLAHKGALFNCACMIADARIVGFVAKRFLPRDGVHYEPRWFQSWPRGVHDTVRVGGESYPIGDLIFDCGGLRIGVEICEDAWVAKRPGADMALQGVDIILNPSATHFAFGKYEVRKGFVIDGSRAYGVSYIHSNLLGNEAGRIIYDGGTMIASVGRLLAAGRRFSFAPRQLVTAVVDVGISRMNQAARRSYAPDLTTHWRHEVSCPFSYPDVEPQPPLRAAAGWESGPHVKEEEFARAVTLGLFDYLRKSRMQGFVVSLSGGADSSATACLVSLMIHLACAELGETGLREALGHIPSLRRVARPGADGIVHDLLHCVYLASSNNTESTRLAATELAGALNARMHCLDIDQMVRSYVAAATVALGRKLTWKTDDMALQNIQARTRGPVVWLLANAENALLLVTSNRSEAAVGYATMDGDTCGSLSPIGGIDKCFLRRWLVWLEKQGPEGCHPIPALAGVNALAPTAELRPVESKQTDEEDLMPYDVLDAIERAAIRDLLPPIDVFRVIRAQFPHHHTTQLHKWVDRFFRLWCRNQWKRERYAPSFHLDDESLDPKTWCRFPILSGGFAKELEELREFVESLSD